MFVIAFQSPAHNKILAVKALGKRKLGRQIEKRDDNIKTRFLGKMCGDSTWMRTIKDRDQHRGLVLEVLPALI